MSKEILKLYLRYNKEIREKYKNQTPKSHIESDFILEKLEKEKSISTPEKIELREPTFQELFPRAYAQDLKKHGYNDVFEVVRENDMLKNDIETLNIKYQQLQEELKKSRESLTRQETANKSLKQILKEAEKGIDENVKTLLNKNSEYKEIVEKREKQISNLIEKIEAQNEEISDLQDVLIDYKQKSNAPASRTYKLFGIPVFSVNNK